MAKDKRAMYGFDDRSINGIVAVDTDGNVAPGMMLVDVNGNPISTLANATGSDGSTTITTGGVAQNLFGGAVPSNGFEICNPDPAEDLWFSDSATAAANGTGSFRIAANGGTYTTPTLYKPIGAVSIIGATTGHKITARKW